jgi:TadE-like protein
MRHHPPARQPNSIAGRPPGAGRGQSVVEFALILPVMLLLLAGAIDLGRAFYAYVAVENAAKEGALYGARHPLCATESATCPDPRNVPWIVENEAANLKDGSGNSLLTTAVSCRTPAGGLVQPLNDCTNGNIYVVSVTSSFRLITPILGDLTSSNLTLGATSEATVVEDAFDPTGLEVLVWVDKAQAENATAIAGKCTQADASGSPGFYYGPCQDQSNVYNYLEYQEGETVTYQVQVRNTGNVDLTSLSYGMLVNGSPVSVPSGCAGLASALARNSQPDDCEFDRTVTATPLPGGSLSDYVVEFTAQGLAAGLPTGGTSGSATVKVVPAPQLDVTLRSERYRLGGDGDGLGGTAQYGSGDLTLDRTTDPSADRSLREPVGWLKLTVTNNGGVARNLSVTITENGSSFSLGACNIPASLSKAGQPGDRFTCILPSVFDDTGLHRFVLSATARNAKPTTGDNQARITTDTCSGTRLVVPNLVDRLLPAPDGSNKTVGQARTLWQDAGFTGPFRTNPSSASNGASVLTQDVNAYTCEDADQDVEVDAR